MTKKKTFDLAFLLRPVDSYMEESTIAKAALRGVSL